MFFPYSYLVARAVDLVNDLTLFPLPSGGQSVVYWISENSFSEEEREELEISPCRIGRGRELYKGLWDEFGQSLLVSVVLMSIDNASPCTEAILINDFVICATRTARDYDDPKHWVPIATTKHEIKSYLLQETGIDESEIHGLRGHAGMAGELKASMLKKKPYRVHPTSRTEDHLTLDEETGCLYILEVASLERFYSAHATGGTEYDPPPCPF